MRGNFALPLAALTALLGPLTAQATVRISAVDSSFTLNLPGGTHQLYESGQYYDISSLADPSSWTAQNGATCNLDAPGTFPTDIVYFDMINGDANGGQYLVPCGWNEGVRVVCTNPESVCGLTGSK